MQLQNIQMIQRMFGFTNDIQLLYIDYNQNASEKHNHVDAYKIPITSNKKVRFESEIDHHYI